MRDDCLLCQADRVTEWHFEDDECWMTDCMVCMTPMIVLRSHGLPDPEDEARLLERLERFASERYPDGVLDRPGTPADSRYWHAHARPAGGFFDPASELHGRYG